MIVKGETNMNNDDKLREQMKSEPVPDRLKPENIKIMLDNEAPKKKRSGISMAGRIAAAAAACTVIGGTAAYTLNNGKLNKNADVASFADMPANEENKTAATQAAETKTKKQARYMSGAKDYEQVYAMFKESAQKAKKESDDNYYKYDAGAEEADEEVVSSADPVPENEAPRTGASDGKGGGYGAGGDSGTPEVPVVDGELPTEPDTDPVALTTESVTENTTEDTTEAPAEPVTEEPATEADPEHSETYYQEQDVLEADIVKTDGKRIYYVGSGTNSDEVYSQVLLNYFFKIRYSMIIKGIKFIVKNTLIIQFVLYFFFFIFEISTFYKTKSISFSILFTNKFNGLFILTTK